MERRIGQINAALKGDSDVDMEEEEKKSVELPNAGEAVNKNSQGLMAMCFPQLFPFGFGDSQPHAQPP